jgi:hypothetical protein
MSMRRRIIWAVIASAILFVLGFLTLGIPGALVIELVGALFAPLGAKVPTGDQAWPAAILVAFLMPLGVLASALVLARRHITAGTAASFAWGALGYLAAGGLLSLVVVFVLAK